MSHNKEFFHTTDSMPGALNDKTVVRFDEYIDALRTDPVYTEFPFTLYDARGAPFEQKGVYTIVDGGYHAWRETIDAYKSSPYLPEMMFTCRQESVRKNVECAFGILKKRCERLNHGRARASAPLRIRGAEIFVISLTRPPFPLSTGSKYSQTAFTCVTLKTATPSSKRG